MSEIQQFLHQVDLFTGLTEDKLARIVTLCRPLTFKADSIIIKRDDPPNNFYLIQQGTVKINTAPKDQAHNFSNSAVILLGKGQSFGEMGLVDEGTRSATVTANTDATLLAINCKLFRALCESDTDLGYQIMKNVAIDLSFKLRYRNMI